MRNSEYGGIDRIKLIAAFLVVAIHTGPLLSYGAEADHVLTGIVARVAVPLFFMASGFLFFRKCTGNPQQDSLRLKRYVQKTTMLYLVSIVLYLPLNLYRGDFSEGFSFLSLLRAVVVDGTFYHLWYLPALILGLLFVYGLHRYLSWSALFTITLLLYTVGLLGDSYYGLTVQLDPLGRAYEGMFHWFSYTRNGLFFAPVFLALGLRAARVSRIRKRGHLLALLLLSLSALLAEGIWLHDASFPRHDSMYIMLLPTVYLLFRLAIASNVESGKVERALSQWIYILHPLAIVLIRGAAGIVGWEQLLVKQSLVHYTAVCVLSVLLAVLTIWMMSRYHARRQSV